MAHCILHLAATSHPLGVVTYTGPDGVAGIELNTYRGQQARLIRGDVEQLVTVLAEWLSRHAPRCVHCGEEATCLGRYETCEGPEEYACDDCCGHGNEDGHCKPIAPTEKDPDA